MAPSSAPKPPRIADRVRLEAGVNVLIEGALGTLAWNFLVAPELGLSTISVFAGVGIAGIVTFAGVVLGYALGLGLARRELGEHEEYGRAAADYIEAVEAELETEDEDAVSVITRRRGGQG